MIHFFDDELRHIDNAILTTALAEIPQLLQDLPLDAFAKLLLNIPPEYQNLTSYFPSMAEDSVQSAWTGAAGDQLLVQSVAFIRTITTKFEKITGKDLQSSRILDYGCGWGRLLRLLYKYTSAENLYGVDPWPAAIALCKKHRVPGNLASSEPVPSSLPFNQRFDLIYAFSVFTHLSAKTMRAALHTLRSSIAEDGILVITIRPVEHWKHLFQDNRAEEMIAMHHRTGFAFTPLDLPAINEDIPYGDSTFTLEYFRRNFPFWNIAQLEYNLIDPHQIILFLTPSR